MTEKVSRKQVQVVVVWNMKKVVGKDFNFHPNIYSTSVRIKDDKSFILQNGYETWSAQYFSSAVATTGGGLQSDRS
jgi:hypothetical protein